MKTLPALLFLSWLPCIASAQGQLQVGIQSGVNFSTVDFRYIDEYDVKNTDYRQGLHAGIFLTYMSGKHFGMQLELNYAQRGWKESLDTAGAVIAPERLPDILENRLINYLEVPLLSHGQFGAGNFKIIMDLGPYIAFAWSAQSTVTDVKTGVVTEGEYVFSDDDNRVDFGLKAGAGFEYELSFGTFMAEARYTFGFANVQKVEFREQELSQQRIIGVHFGFRVPIAGGFKDDQEKAEP
jgi:hypothetical protein